MHLLLNHVPIFGVMFGTPLLAYGMIRKSVEIKKLALLLLIFSALISVPVFFTGEPAEEVVENLAGVSEFYIEQHEEAARVAFSATIAAGILSFIGFIFVYFNIGKQRFLLGTTLLISMLAAVLMGRAANLGGEIRHSEIRQSNSISTQTTSEKKLETNIQTMMIDRHNQTNSLFIYRSHK
jgi:uncharacterized membrane protein